MLISMPIPYSSIMVSCSRRQGPINISAHSQKTKTSLIPGKGNYLVGAKLIQNCLRRIEDTFEWVHYPCSHLSESSSTIFLRPANLLPVRIHLGIYQHCIHPIAHCRLNP